MDNWKWLAARIEPQATKDIRSHIRLPTGVIVLRSSGRVNPFPPKQRRRCAQDPR
jgi:hypothetical protein